MLKHTLSLALLATTATTAMAANVMVYGSIDTGIQVLHNKGGDTNVTMESGQSWGSRFGLLATEDLAEGYQVIANLQNGYASDSGSTLYNSDRNRFFSRESTLSLKTPYGQFGMGRMGTLSGSVGTYSMWAGWADPLGTAYLDAGIQGTMYGLGRTDNTIVYQTPVYAGWQAGLMYSFDGMAIDPSRDYETESAGHTNRVANAAVTYFGSQFSMQAAVETVFWENNSKFNAKLKDSTDIGLSFQYDFNWAKFWLTGQYMKNVNMLGAHSVNADIVRTDTSTGLVNDSGEGITGYAVAVAAKVPLWGGNWYTQLQFFDGEYDYSSTDKELEMKRYVASLGYVYNLSKKTWIYAMASHSVGGGDWKHSRLTKLNTEDRVNRTALQMGLNMMF